MPNLPSLVSMSGSFAFVSSNFGRTQRYQTQFVNASGDKQPRKFSLLSLNVKLTALQFFSFAIVPEASSSSSFSFSLFFFPFSASLSSSSSSSPPPASSLPGASPPSSFAFSRRMSSASSSPSSSSSSLSSGF